VRNLVIFKCDRRAFKMQDMWTAKLIQSMRGQSCVYLEGRTQANLVCSVRSGPSSSSIMAWVSFNTKSGGGEGSV
jgi:hypothetical protein